MLNGGEGEVTQDQTNAKKAVHCLSTSLEALIQLVDIACIGLVRLDENYKMKATVCSYLFRLFNKTIRVCVEQADKVAQDKASKPKEHHSSQRHLSLSSQELQEHL